jgi:hypothetical protein
MLIKAKSTLSLRIIVFVGCGAALTWLVLSRSLAAYLAEVAPQSALWLNPEQPEALVNLANSALNGPARSSEGVLEQSPEQPKTASDDKTADVKDKANNSRYFKNVFVAVDGNRSVDLATVQSWSETALIHEPLNAQALRILGQAADAARDDADAAKFMQSAVRLSLHETTAAYWLMRKSTAAKDYSTAIYYADVLLRTRPEFAPYVVPLLARAAEDRQAIGLLKTVLSNDPPWRKQFLVALPSSVTDVRTPLDLLLSLRKGPAPLKPADIDGYLQFLIAHKFYDLAYYTWLQFLPPEELRAAGLLFDGDFEVVPSGLPFDWKITPGSGVTIDIVPRSDKPAGHALLIDFLYGRVEYHSVVQLVMLNPGTYAFKGKYKGELAGPRGLKWRVVCAGDAGTKVGESAAISGRTRGWADVAFSFTVPTSNCRAQYVRLDLDARMASEQLVSGSMSFDELQISRLKGSPTIAGSAE